MANLKISDNTVITLPIFVALAGFIYWLTTLYNLTVKNRDDIADVKATVSSQNAYFERMSKMESKLDLIYELVVESERKRQQSIQK